MDSRLTELSGDRRHGDVQRQGQHVRERQQPQPVADTEANLSTLGFLLHDVARLLKKRFEQHARGAGLTWSQWQVLAFLARNEGISQRALAELLEVEPITLARIADRLERLGLARRLPHPSDRRVWLLRLTPAAHPKLEQVRELGDVSRSEALAGISEADRRRLSKTLQVVKANLTEACDAPTARQPQQGAGVG
jgi:MarR family transcriptional regulator, transcriptional regulator for hemolysin